MSKEVTDFLFGGGGKAFKFDEIGDTVEGRIEDVKVAQQTSMETNEPLTWSDGRPRNQLVVTLRTELRDDNDDDGIRMLYAKGGNYEVASGTGTSMKDAISDALRKAQSKTIDEGGWLKVGYTGEGKKTNRGFSAPKLYRAQYEPPKATVAADDLFDE